MRRIFCIALAVGLSGSGIAADPSLECSLDSGSQVETGNCLGEVEATVQQALELMLGFARDGAAELDQITERDVAVPALDNAQAAWEAYRDKQCDYAGALFGGGSGTGIEITSCRIEITRDRIKALRAALQ